MNIYNFSSGDNDSSNDYIRMQVAMNAESQSRIKIYNSGTTGIIEYQTKSDYIWKFERVKYVSEQIVQLSSSQADKLGYPESMPWIPGESISPLSSNENVTIGNLGPLTKKSDLSQSEYVHSGKIILEDYYDEPWSPQGVVEVSNVYSTEGNMPFVEIEENDISSTGSIALTSSSLQGCIFNIDIKRNFISGNSNETGSLILPDKFVAQTNSSQKKGDMLEEWNSIFEINKNCNADSIFKSGENRDEVFMGQIKEYLDYNWNGKMKSNLWGDYIDNEEIELSSRDPLVLKNHIFYCFYYFGASDDIYHLAQYSYGYQYNNMNWHIGLGGKSNFSDNIRAIRTELSYLPVIKETKEVSRVYGLPPKSAYSYNIENNINISNFLGSVNPDGTTNQNGINSNNY